MATGTPLPPVMSRTSRRWRSESTSFHTEASERSLAALSFEGLRCSASPGCDPDVLIDGFEALARSPGVLSGSFSLSPSPKHVCHKGARLVRWVALPVTGLHRV
eukprot:2101254-Prymnesium_polylepis.1